MFYTYPNFSMSVRNLTDSVGNGSSITRSNSQNSGVSPVQDSGVSSSQKFGEACLLEPPFAGALVSGSLGSRLGEAPDIQVSLDWFSGSALLTPEGFDVLKTQIFTFNSDVNSYLYTYRSNVSCDFKKFCFLLTGEYGQKLYVSPVFDLSNHDVFEVICSDGTSPELLFDENGVGVLPYDLFERIPNYLSIAQGYSVVLKLPGEFFHNKFTGLVDQSSLLWSLLIEHNFICSRLDVNFTDFNNYLNIFDIVSAKFSKNFSGAKTSNINFLGDDGLLISFGSRGNSEAYTRIYDFFKKHGKPGVRFEVEFNRSKAQSLFSEISDLYHSLYLVQDFCSGQLEAFVFSVVVGQIDFIDRTSGDKNLSRCSRLPWWADFLDKVSCLNPFRIPTARQKPPSEPNQILKRRFSWLIRSWLRTLAIIKEASDYDSFLKFFIKLTRLANFNDEDLLLSEVLSRYSLIDFVPSDLREDYRNAFCPTIKLV